jgi:hypothetical protein
VTTIRASGDKILLFEELCIGRLALCVKVKQANNNGLTSQILFANLIKNNVK